MKTRSIACIIVFVLATSCKKEERAASTGNDESAPRHRTEGFSGEDRRRDRANPDRKQDRARQLVFSKLLESARKSFDSHDISSALTVLEEAGDLYEAHPDMLSLRGNCHVELRDFEKALADFSQALKKMPNSPAIHFNIGEVHFVSKRWDDAIQSFNQAKDRLAPGSDALLQLIDFKLMLCEAGRSSRFSLPLHRAATRSYPRQSPMVISANSPTGMASATITESSISGAYHWVRATPGCI